jgi:hypothetical protein
MNEHFNWLLDRTHAGAPQQAIISFWAFRVLPARSSQHQR